MSPIFPQQNGSAQRLPCSKQTGSWAVRIQNKDDVSREGLGCVEIWIPQCHPDQMLLRGYCNCHNRCHR